MIRFSGKKTVSQTPILLSDSINARINGIEEKDSGKI
jgi:hypothetical protein